MNGDSGIVTSISSLNAVCSVELKQERLIATERNVNITKSDNVEKRNSKIKGEIGRGGKVRSSVPC